MTKRKNSRKPAPDPALVAERVDDFKPNSTVQVKVFAKGTEDEDLQALMAAATAQHLTRPEVVSARVVDAYQPDMHDVNALADELARQIETVNRGDLSRAEGLLVAQAQALDRVFGSLIVTAAHQQLLPHWETYMRMALRAQNQCRATIESLAALKYPSAIFTHQANINHGQQQVNNGVTPPPLDTRVPEGEVGPTKLLEAGDGQRLDTRAQGKSGTGDPLLAPVGAIDRIAKRRGQGEGGTQRVERRHEAGIAPARKAAAATASHARRAGE